MERILLVEDDKMNRHMITRQLEWHGFEVITASDGLQAINMTVSERPDLILMDMGLPVLDGWQAASHIKADPELCGIPIIALTAFAIAGDRERCLAAGCNAYETKPIDFSQLLVVMRQLLAAS